MQYTYAAAAMTIVKSGMQFLMYDVENSVST